MLRHAQLAAPCCYGTADLLQFVAFCHVPMMGEHQGTCKGNIQERREWLKPLCLLGFWRSSRKFPFLA